MQTVLTSFESNTLFSGGNTGSITHTISSNVTNMAGFFSGIIRVNSAADCENIGMEWRPKLTVPGTSLTKQRLLPTFLDLEPGDDGGTGLENAGSLPDYALFQNLGIDKLATDNIHYIYFVHPETPAAIPLIRDDSTSHDGFEVRVHAEDPETGTATFNYDLYILHTVLS